MYHEEVTTLAEDAEQMEALYRTAMTAGDEDAFRKAIDAGYTAAPDNLLYAAWFHRLQAGVERAKGVAIAWGWVIPLALANGLLLWWLSDEERYAITFIGPTDVGPDRFLPAFFILAAPISAAFVMLYFTAVAHRQRPWRVAIAVLPFLAAGYVFWSYPRTGTRPFQEQYLTLMLLHLPLLAWAGVGAFLLGQQRDPANRFAFLIKSLELFILGGLFAIAGGLFTAITFGLFDALDVTIGNEVQRLFFAGGAGLVPVVATAVIYNPMANPAEQAFDEGLSKLIALLMRIMLPLTLLVLLVYLAFIPFNFRAPFENRDVLVIYNGMLFAVIALLVGATPIRQRDLTPRLARWLRRGIIAVAALALLVGVYALAAILYRTGLDRLTPNRLAFIGWNSVNIGLLLYLLRLQFEDGDERWIERLYRAYSAGIVVYVVWTATVVLIIPWLFTIDRAELETLPVSVQQVIYDQPPPILLRCASSPHIYLLESGQKRWVKDIPTFTERGFLWRDVRRVPCDDLRLVPDGTPIPANAGPPPAP